LRGIGHLSLDASDVRFVDSPRQRHDAADHAVQHVETRGAAAYRSPSAGCRLQRRVTVGGDTDVEAHCRVSDSEVAVGPAVGLLSFAAVRLASLSTPTPSSKTSARTSTTPGWAPNAPSATMSSTSKPSATRSPSNPPLPDRLHLHKPFPAPPVAIACPLAFIFPLVACLAGRAHKGQEMIVGLLSLDPPLR